MSYDEHYYQYNAQNHDRPALWFYARLWRHYCKGPALEFGCGTGHFAHRLSAFSEVLGIEINPYAIRKICKNAPKVKLIPTLSDIDDTSIGSIVSLHVLEHIPNEQLDDIGIQFIRILRPRGRILITVPDLTGRAHSLKGNTWMGFRDSTHVNLKGADDWLKYFQEKWGVKVIKYGADGYYDYPYGRSMFDRAWGDIRRIFRTGLQFLLARIILSPGDGEAVIFVLEK